MYLFVMLSMTFVDILPSYLLYIVSYRLQVHTNYFNELVEGYRGRLDKLISLFDEFGVPYARPQGTFFIVIDVSKIQIPEKYLSEQPTRDWAFSVWAIEQGGVATIPCSVFYCDEDKHIVR